MIQLEEGAFTVKENKLVYEKGGKIENILTIINANDQKEMNVRDLIAFVALSGHTFAEEQTSQDQRSDRYILVPVEISIAADIAPAAKVLRTDSDEYIILDARNVTSEYGVLLLTGSDISGGKPDDIAIVVICFATSEVKIFNSFVKYDCWLIQHQRAYVEGRSKVNICARGSGAPVPAYNWETKKYRFADETFVKVKNLPTVTGASVAFRTPHDNARIDTSKRNSLQ